MTIILDVHDWVLPVFHYAHYLIEDINDIVFVEAQIPINVIAKIDPLT